MRRLALAIALLAASSALAADRHVYLDTGFDGQLNDCPNPAHNAKGTSNTDELSYCAGGGATAGKVIGVNNNACTGSGAPYACCTGSGTGTCIAVSGTVTAAACTTDGGDGVGVVTNVTSNLTGVDIDRDGTPEAVYGHPQACVWHMSRGDSCEVHAGTYKRAGAISDWDASGAEDVVDRSDCWLATVAALGYGADGSIGTDGAGYGTSTSAPAILRGAWIDANANGTEQSGEVDTWDSNRNKRPDSDEAVTRYPAIFSGDTGSWDGTPTGYTATSDGIGKQPTFCNSDAVVKGDAFYPLMWGCGDSVEVCDASISGGETRPRIDTDANGTFDTMISGGARDTSNFVIKDIEGKDYGGGPLTCSGSGVREKLGHFSLGGDKSSGGFVADRIYFHDNGYSNLCQGEHYCSIFGDDENSGCPRDHEMKNSYLVLNNRFVINDDSDSWGGGDTQSGCGWDFHDNRVDVVSNPGCEDFPGTGPCRKGIFRWKSIDSLQGCSNPPMRPKRIRLWNNELIWNTSTADGGDAAWMFHSECIGECGPCNPGWGQFWFHGNIVRAMSGAALGSTFIGGGCTSDGSPNSSSYRFYSFSNTFDYAFGTDTSTKTLGTMCNSGQSGEIIAQRNNVYYRATTVNADTGVTVTRAANVCSQSGQPSCTQSSATDSRAELWTGSTWSAAVHSGLTNYTPVTSGPLDEQGSCDTDGDGFPGYDPDGNEGSETAITTWYDIAGNFVDCRSTCSGGSTPGAVCTTTCPGGGTCVAPTLDIGAVQTAADPGGGGTCGDGTVVSPETCDDGNTSVTACEYDDSPPYTQVCDSDCIENVNCDQPRWCGDSTINGPEECDTAQLGGQSCASLGCTGGTLSCSAGTYAAGGCRFQGCTGCGVETMLGVICNGCVIP